MEKQVKIKTGRSLSQIVDLIVKESSEKVQMYHNTLDEKRRQSQMLDEEDDDLFGDEDAADDKPKSSKTLDDETEKMKKGKISVDDVVSKLNTIRGGKSFKDDQVANKLDEYFNSLSKAEKTALFAFLKGLSQVVTGEVDTADIVDPSNPPAEVNIEKLGDKKAKVQVKASVIKVPKKEEKEKKDEKKSSSKEDTSGPVPITPKK